jgi:SWIM zinc finger
MEEISFLVQGSAEEPYRVTFRKKDNNLSAYCTCPAGQNGQYCKHRFNILRGITRGIVCGNEVKVQVVASWLSGTDVEAALRAVSDSQKQFERAKFELSAAKKRLAKSFRDWTTLIKGRPPAFISR